MKADDIMCVFRSLYAGRQRRDAGVRKTWNCIVSDPRARETGMSQVQGRKTAGSDMSCFQFFGEFVILDKARRMI